MDNERVVYRACPLCQSADIHRLTAVDCTRHAIWREPLEPVISWMRCGACQHVFTEGYFTGAALEILAGTTHDMRTVGNDIEVQRKIAAPMVERVGRITGLPDGQLWLDVGIGSGALLMTAKEFGFDVLGIDPWKRNVDEIQTRFHISARHGALKDLASDLAFTLKPAVISLADVVAQEPFPLDLLRHARQLITDAGVLLISMPNADAPLWHHWDSVNKNPYWYEIEHYHNFTRRSLYAALQRAGFKPVHYNISERYRCCMEVLAVPTTQDGATSIVSGIGADSADPRKRGCEFLRAEVERDPGNAQLVFHLAQSYFDSGDFASAREWYERRAELGGEGEEVYAAMFGAAVSMTELGEPWPVVQDAYLQAWKYRPSRAEPLHDIARHHREAQNYHLGYLFGKDAAAIPRPDGDRLMVYADVYAWRAADEQAVCASQIGEHPEAFGLFRRLITVTDLPEDERQRMAGNRDFSVPAMLSAAAAYPAELVAAQCAHPPADEVTVTVFAGPEAAELEITLNSLLNTCRDADRVGRFLVIDLGLPDADRLMLQQRYGFVQFVDTGPDRSRIRALVDGRYWLHLGQGWRFFAPEALITRLTGVLDAEPEVIAVGVNYADATTLIGRCATELVVRRTAQAGRYTLTGDILTGPAMFDTARLDRAGHTTPAATLDEVLCIREP